MLLELLLCMFVMKVNGLIGYQCGSENANITRIDLTSIPECATLTDEPITKSTSIQVIQKKTYLPISYQTCLIEITRTVYNCNWDQEVSQVQDGHYSYIHTLGKEECSNVHRYKSLELFQASINDLVINSSRTIPITIAGSISTGGWCKNVGKYVDSGGVYNDVFVQGTIKITLRSGTAFLNIQESGVKIPTLGLECSSQDNYCMDVNHGEVVWESTNTPECMTQYIDVLYQGPATFLTITKSHGNTTMITVKEQNHIFGLKITKATRFCSQILWQTEHPRILVSEVTPLGFTFPDTTTISPSNIDLMSYVNSKFLYTTLNIYSTVTSLYKALSRQACEAKRSSLENRLALARLDPIYVSQLIGKRAGVYGRVMGEVLYIMECTPVPVKLRKSDKCYQEIPIYYGLNKTGFLSPITRTIVSHGQVAPCLATIPPMFNMGENWISRLPSSVLSTPPKQLDPNEDRDTWEYIPNIDIGTAGLYTMEDMEALQNMMMFPSLQKAISVDLASKIDATHQEFSYSDIFNERDMTSLSNNIGSKISWFFGWFGHWASIILGVILAWKIILYIISVWSNWKLLRMSGSTIGEGLWVYGLGLIDSLTHLFMVHKTKKRQATTPADPSEESPSAPILMKDLAPVHGPQDQVVRPSEEAIRRGGLFPSLY